MSCRTDAVFEACWNISFGKADVAPLFHAELRRCLSASNLKRWNLTGRILSALYVIRQQRLKTEGDEMRSLEMIPLS